MEGPNRDGKVPDGFFGGSVEEAQLDFGFDGGDFPLVGFGGGFWCRSRWGSLDLVRELGQGKCALQLAVGFVGGGLGAWQRGCWVESVGVLAEGEPGCKAASQDQDGKDGGVSLGGRHGQGIRYLVRDRWRVNPLLGNEQIVMLESVRDGAVHGRVKRMRILIVDDDPKLQAFVSDGLSESGMECATAGSPDEALEVLDAHPDGFDLLLLDVMMPGRSGWELLEQLRAGGDSTPAIFVSARGAVEERVRGLQMGADDYIVKPFAFEELLARIDAVIRRRAAMPVLRHAGLVLDSGRRRVEVDGKLVDLSPKEYELLLAFLNAGEAVLGRAQLLELVWDVTHDPGTNVVEVHIARLRRKLGKRGKQLIQTISGAGYRLGLPGPPESGR